MSDKTEHAIDDLLTDLGGIAFDLDTLGGRVLDHVPDLPDCSGPIGRAQAGLLVLQSYLAGEKKRLESPNQGA